MDILEKNRTCLQCHKENKFLIVLNKCGFEICLNHFSQYDKAQRFNCPICKNHEISLSECMKVDRNSFIVAAKDVFDELDKIDEKNLEYSRLRKNPQGFIYEKHNDLFDELDRRRCQLKSELSRQIDIYHDQLKEFYELKVNKHVKLVKNSLKQIDLDLKSNFINSLRELNNQPIKNQFSVIESYKEQIKETKSKLREVDSLYDHKELSFVHRPFSMVQLNIQNIFGRFKFNEKKSLSCLDQLNLKRTLQQHNGPVVMVTELINGDLVSASHDKTIKIWNKDNGECIETLSEHSDKITDLKVISSTFCSVSKDKNIFFWETSSSNVARKHKCNEEITCLAVFENGNGLVTGSKDGYLRFWNFESLNMYKEIKAHEKSVYSILILSSNYYVSCSADRTVKLWSLNSNAGEAEKVYEEHEDYVWCLEKVNENKFLSGSNDNRIILWNSGEIKSSFKYEGHTDIVRCIKMKNDHEFLSCSADGTVLQWNLVKKEPEKKISIQDNIPIYSLFITNENELVLALKNGYLQLWSSNLF